MAFTKAKRPAIVVVTKGASEADQLGRLICFDANPILSNFQTIFIARRFGLSPATAAAIATLHFGEGAR